MKLLLKSLATGLVLTVLFSMIPFANNCNALENDIFRLHILANSDNEWDQELKLQVRDRILDYTKDLYSQCGTKSDTINVTQKNLGRILNIASDEIQLRGYDYSVEGNIRKMYFNTRTYGKYTIPSGMYDALEIKIGEGKGHNWWCVMYPSFCLGESCDLENSSLSDEEKELVTDNSEYKIKFKIVEVFEKIKSFF